MGNKLLAIFLVGIFCFNIGLVSAEICPWYNPMGWWSECGSMPYNNSIGYEFIDGGDVVHIWNNATISDYFFDKDSGIQLTNHYEDYWTKNTFCIGYYNNNEWNKIACANELTNFQKSIESDNETYVNATLWKDIGYGAYDLRLGVQYHLGLNDENLSITIYGKNIGIDIPFDLGFAWKVTDIDIATEEQDYITLNDTRYPLNGTYDITFTNMTTFSTIAGNGTELNMTTSTYTPSSTLNINDRYDFLRMDWNKNINYAVKMYGDGNQENFYTALLINAGHFSPNQEKSTTIQWVDAEGDYEGYFSGPAALRGVATDGTNIWVSTYGASKATIWKRAMNGDAINSWTSAANDDEGLATDGTNIWTVDQTATQVYKYDMDGTPISNWDTAGNGNGVPYGITTDGTNIWTTDSTDDEIYKWDMDGDYVSKFSLHVNNDNPTGVATIGDYIWVLQRTTDTVYKYELDGTYDSQWTSSQAIGDSLGLEVSADQFWITDRTTNKVFYFEPPVIVTDTCTYTSGTWEVDCADNCTIEADVDLGGEDIVINGSGTFTITGANITNFGDSSSVTGTNGSSICIVRCLNGGCLNF